VIATLNKIGNQGHVTIYTDYKSIVSFFDSPPKPSKIKSYHELFRNKLNQFSGTIKFNLIKGHSKIPGNDAAHQLARLGAQQAHFQTYFNSK
jgi:ribonuclease HI